MPRSGGAETLPLSFRNAAQPQISTDRFPHQKPGVLGRGPGHNALDAEPHSGPNIRVAFALTICVTTRHQIHKRLGTPQRAERGRQRRQIKIVVALIESYACSRIESVRRPRGTTA